MKLICFSLVKNEEDILEAFVRHTLNQVDHLYIADNLSTDGTADILSALAAEGLPITVATDSEVALLQNEKMTKMYRDVATTHEFDVAFFLDADEFLLLERDILEETWKKFGGGRAYYIPRTNYLYQREPRPKDPLSIFEAMDTVDVVPEDPKSVIFHDGLKCKRFRIGNGNHHVRDWAREGRIISEDQERSFAQILHFPIRSVDQYMRKALLGWLALQLRESGVNNATRTIGSHWRAQYRKVLEQDCELTPERVMKNLYGPDIGSRIGSYTPFAPDIKLLHTRLMKRPSLVAQLTRMYEHTIDAIWVERQERQPGRTAH